MYRHRRILVAMSLTEQDAAAIRYAGLIARLARSEKITFMHVTSTFDTLIDELGAEFPDLRQASGDPGKALMKELVQSHLPADQPAALEYDIVEGSPLLELLRRARADETDLVIMVKKREPQESGSLPEKVIRRIPCSVLLVPEKAAPDFSRILVPTDFSDASVDAMDVAVAFASAKHLQTIHCLHAYAVPLGYYKTGKSHEQFAAIMKGHAEKNYRLFLQKEVCQADSVCQIQDLRSITITPIFKLEKKASRAIEETIGELDIDLLIIGARGRHAGAGVLLGSVTEHQIRHTTISILAVKKKGTGMNLLDALLAL